jgi:hypothetical protein
MWGVICGATEFGGETEEGLTTNPPRHPPQVKVSGKLVLCAKILEKLWKRPVTVPKGLRGKIVKRTVKGTPEEIAKVLGLELGPKRKR